MQDFFTFFYILFLFLSYGIKWINERVEVIVVVVGG